MQAGAWINVVGYITGRKVNPTYTTNVGSTPVYSEVAVQAVMMWSAVELKIEEYETALAARKACDTAG